MMPARLHVVDLFRSPVALAAAALLVGIAIVWDSAAGRALNGIGGFVWVGCAAVMARAVISDQRRFVIGGLVMALALFFAVVVRPSDGLIAVGAFGLGGAAIAAISQPRVVAWGVLLPAIWLPVHVGVAVVRSIAIGEGSVRTDPPPTTAIVPLLMVLAAWAGAHIVARFMGTRDTATQLPANNLAGLGTQSRPPST